LDERRLFDVGGFLMWEALEGKRIAEEKRIAKEKVLEEDC
jgi:hypothetical protein